NSPKRARVTLIATDGTRIPADFQAVSGDPKRWEWVPPAVSNAPKYVLTWSETGSHFLLFEVVPATPDSPEIHKRVRSKKFKAELWDVSTGYRVDGNGRLLDRFGQRLPEESLYLWNALNAAEKRLISPE